VRLLVEHGGEVNARESEHGQTPLIFAAAFDRPAVIEELVKLGAELNLQTVIQPYVQIPADGVPPRSATANPVGPDGKELFMAVRAKTPSPAPPDGGDRGGGNPRGGLTPLMYAARDGHMAAVQTLVEHGAGLDV